MSEHNSLASSLLFKHLNDFDDIAVAVSGGSDSLALLYLLHEWAKARSKKLSVLTVDHQLRAGARDEAAYVGELCARLGLLHHILRWEDDKPKTGLAAAARGARYELMARHCARAHIQALVLGHTCDDQAETVLMRLRRTDEQNRGLSGMAATTLFAPSPECRVMLCRPLLGVFRAELRSYLSSRAVDWVDDPSNQDRDYERVRIREELSAAPAFSQQLIDYARVHAQTRQQLAADVARFIEQHCCVSAYDCVRIEQAKLDEQPMAVAVLALQVLLCVAGGRDHLPSAMKVEEEMAQKASSTLARVQLNRVQLSDVSSHLMLHREARNLPPVCRLDMGAMLWDQRFWLMRNDDLRDADRGWDIEISSGEYFLANFGDDLASSESVIFSSTSKFDQRALAAMPFGRICDKNHKTNGFIVMTEASNKQLTVRRALGAFDRYCTEFDFPIRRALERLFTVKRLNT